MKTIIAVSSLLVLFLLSTAAHAQDEQQAQENQAEEAPYWYVSYYKIPWEKVDSLQQIESAFGGRMDEEAIRRGNILERKLLVHHTGSEYNVVIMTKYPTWQAIESGPNWMEIFEAIEPDAETRTQVNEAMEWIFENTESHRDEIYREITGGQME